MSKSTGIFIENNINTTTKELPKKDDSLRADVADQFMNAVENSSSTSASSSLHLSTRQPSQRDDIADLFFEALENQPQPQPQPQSQARIIPTPPTSPTPSHTSPHKLHQLSSALLDDSNGSLPLLSTSKEAKSARPKALLEGVKKRVNQLLVELQAIKLQSFARRLIAERKVRGMLYLRRMALSLVIPLYEELLERECIVGCVMTANEVRVWGVRG